MDSLTSPFSHESCRRCVKTRVFSYKIPIVVASAVLQCLVLVACGKKAGSQAKAGTNTPPAESPASTEPQPAQAANPQPSAPLAGAGHGFMTQQLRVFVQQKGRMPETFGEFSSARMDSVPRPPDGFRWAIDAATVEVKLVRQ